ncbi:MAG: O-antigen ligase family protein [Ktedonobacteraceae bacterium]|nr:O-antigen ligase family protein [Chloroflexota bacterium]
MKQGIGRNSAPKQREASSARTISFPPATLTATLVVYLGLTAALAFLMTNSTIGPIAGLIGAVVINLVVLFFMRSEVALPLYLLVAGPSVALSLSSSGVLSRLYIGNMLFFLIVLIWLLFRLLPNRKSGRPILVPALMWPLLGLILAGIVSIAYSHIAPDPHVSYTFPHSTTSVVVTNAAELMLLMGLPMFLVVVPGMVHTVRQVKWVIAAYSIIGMVYALGTIFAAPLGLYSKEVILGVRRPEIFGSVSSGLGTLIVLFTCIALCQALYAIQSVKRLGWVALTALFSIGVIMTIGRESWVALLLAALAIIAIYTRNWKAPLAALLLLLPLVVITGATDFFDPAKTYGTDRFKIWQDAITIWQHSPLIGIGAGNYQFFDLAYGTDIVGVAHNQYLQVLAEMGIPGFASLLWALVSVLWICIKNFRTTKTRLGRSLALAYIGYFVSVIFGGFFTSSFVPSAANGGGTAAFVEVSYRWLLLGLVLSIPNWEAEAVSSEAEANAQKQKDLSRPPIEAVSLPSKTL